MSASVTSIEAARKAKAALQWQALILAQMNEEKASFCTVGQEGIRAFLLQNAKFLYEVAKR